MAVKLTMEATVNKMKEQVTLERKDFQGIHLVKGLCPKFIKNSQKTVQLKIGQNI